MVMSTHDQVNFPSHLLSQQLLVWYPHMSDRYNQVTPLFLF
jgi:hypothetical protein